MPRIKSAKREKRRERTGTVDVIVFCALESNAYGLGEGWYEWTEDCNVPKEECGTLTLAPLPNEPYRRWLRDQAALHKRAVRRGRMKQDQIDEIDIRAIAMFIVKGWSGFMDETTKGPEGEDIEIEYTTERGFNALWNDRGLLDLVCDIARDEAIFGNAENDVESAVKN